MIYLMRHGRDDDNRLGGWSDAPLCPEGVREAQEAAKRIKAEYGIAHIFSSDLPRAMQTAQIVAEALSLPVTPLAVFRETNNGDLAGISRERFQEEYPGLYYSSLAWEQAYPNGESPKQFYERVEQGWLTFRRRLDRAGEDTLLVTHQGVIDVILCLERGEAYTNRHLTFPVSHASVAAAHPPPGG